MPVDAFTVPLSLGEWCDPIWEDQGPEGVKIPDYATAYLLQEDSGPVEVHFTHHEDGGGPVFSLEEAEHFVGSLLGLIAEAKR